MQVAGQLGLPVCGLGSGVLNSAGGDGRAGQGRAHAGKTGAARYHMGHMLAAPAEHAGLADVMAK